MDPELKNMLKETLELTRSNNELLLKLRKTQKWAMYYRVGYWIVILGISFGAYYAIEPYLGSIFNYYGQVSGATSDISKSIPDLKHVQDLLNQFQNK